MSETNKQDVRWQQRLSNFKGALMQLTAAAELAASRELSLLEQQGLIQAFEFTHELAWNVMKDYARYQGNNTLTGSRDASREAFKMGLVTNGEVWMEMIVSHNQTTHTYNQKVAKEITSKILNVYVAAFEQFNLKMESMSA